MAVQPPSLGCQTDIDDVPNVPSFPPLPFPRVYTSSGAFTTYRPESPAQAGHVEPPPTEMHTYLPIYPHVAALLCSQRYEAALLCGRLVYIWLRSATADSYAESAYGG